MTVSIPSSSDTPCHDAAPATTSFDLYPLSHLASLQKEGINARVIHFVRHAEGTHNVNKAYRDMENLDARLTDLGKLQCNELAESLHKSSSSSLLQNTELIVTSSMTRCIQTALLSFPTLVSSDDHSGVKFVAHESIRETVNFNCDKRRLRSETSTEFPMIDFSHISHEEDMIWKYYEKRLGSHDVYTEHRESGDLHRVVERGRDFLNWLCHQNDDSCRNEKKEVIVCSHSAFFRCILNWGQEGGVPTKPPQFNEEHYEKAVPLVNYCGDDEGFECWMRANYDNCELRSFVLVHHST